eukprot:6188718-Pleurochrysis_carterae.AAC.3
MVAIVSGLSSFYEAPGVIVCLCSPFEEKAFWNFFQLQGVTLRTRLKLSSSCARICCSHCARKTPSLCIASESARRHATATRAA